MRDGMIRETRMGQLGFFDADKRLTALSAKGDPLEAIDRLVPWESYRADIEAVVLTPDEMRKSSAGRKPVDAIVMFRMLVLQALNRAPRTMTFWRRDREVARIGEHFHGRSDADASALGAAAGRSGAA